MMQGRSLLECTLWIALWILGAHSKPLVVTTSNFESIIADDSKPVLIDIYAPWCSRCRLLEPVWAELADVLEGKVTVAKIDATENEILRNRFFVTVYPTIVLLRDGKTRVYRGYRTVNDLHGWALHDWEDTEPVAFYKAPNSKFGRFLGQVLGLPSRVLKFQQYLRDVWHFSELMIVLLFLAGPLVLGLLFIWFLDRWAVSDARRETVRHAHQS